MATLLEELSQLISALDAGGIEYAVCGGLALTIHGFPRATFDIDILIQAESLENLTWQNKNLWIVSRKGLIKMKTLAGRAKDLIDIDRIENEES